MTSFSTRFLFACLAVLLLAGASRAVSAAAPCDAPWMHQGGGFSVTATPSGHVIDFSVTDFAKTDGGNCKGAIQTDFSLTIGGQKTQSQSVMAIEIADGKVRPPSESASGQLQAKSGAGAMSAALQSQASGLLSYAGEVTGEGQRLPGTRTEVSMDGLLSKLGVAAGQISVPKMVLVTSEKVVGKTEQLDTPLGRYQCWPISYERHQEGAPAMVMGMSANLNASAQVVDHFCPASGLVMREDLTANNKSTMLAVTALH